MKELLKKLIGKTPPPKQPEIVKCGLDETNIKMGEIIFAKKLIATQWKN
jgi:hypothetical protein